MRVLVKTARNARRTSIWRLIVPTQQIELAFLVSRRHHVPQGSIAGAVALGSLVSVSHVPCHLKIFITCNVRKGSTAPGVMSGAARAK